MLDIANAAIIWKTSQEVLAWSIIVPSLSHIIDLASDGQQEWSHRITPVIAFKAVQRNVANLTRLPFADHNRFGTQHVIQALHDKDHHGCCKGHQELSRQALWPENSKHICRLPQPFRMDKCEQQKQELDVITSRQPDQVCRIRVNFDVAYFRPEEKAWGSQVQTLFMKAQEPRLIIATECRLHTLQCSCMQRPARGLQASR